MTPSFLLRNENLLAFFGSVNSHTTWNSFWGARHGCLPIEIRTSPVGIDDGGSVIDELANSYSTTAYHFELAQTDGVFYPSQIEIKDFVPPIQTDWSRIESSIDDVELFFSFFHDLVRTPVPSGQGTLVKTTNISMVRVEDWAPNDMENIFSLDRVPKLGSHVDSRTGEVLISKRIENVIAVDLDKAEDYGPAIPNSDQIWRQSWFYWAAVACIGTFLVCLSRIFESNRRSSPKENESEQAS